MPSAGHVTVDGHDIVKDYRAARSMIGLVPQELTTDAFETVLVATSRSAAACSASRRIRRYIEKVLKDLSLWDKKDAKIITLSGGMKRRVMIAKALSHEPHILFLDEPTAGVDVELRRDMWELVRALRDNGVTIILTTHYIEEAEEMADRVGVINKGELILVEDKAALMRKLGKKQLTLRAAEPAHRDPARRSPPIQLALADDGSELVYTYDTRGERTGHRRAARRPRRRRASASGTCRPTRARSRTSSSALVRQTCMNLHAVRAIYTFEMTRTFRTLLQSVVSPVISTSLYFVVFGAAIGSRITEVDGVTYGAFIVPGLIMLSVLTQSIANASFAHLLPEIHRHDLRAAVRAGLLARDRRWPMSARRPPSRSCSA